MTTIDTEDPVAVVSAIYTGYTGDLTTLRRLLAEHPGLAMRGWVTIIPRECRAPSSTS